MTKEERDAVVAAIIEDAEGVFASIREDLRRAPPGMTEDQIDSSEGYARFVLGFPKAQPALPSPEHIEEATAVLDAKLAEETAKRGAGE